MKKKVLEIISFIIIVLTILMTFVFSCLAAYNIADLKVYEIYLAIAGSISLILYIINKIVNKKISIYEIIIFILGILACISLTNAINIDIAIFGKLNRHEGLLAILSYYSLFLLGTCVINKKYLKIIISTIFLVGILNYFYGLFQIGVLSTDIIEIKGSWTYAKGLVGNSMFFGTLMSLCYGLVLGIFLKQDKLNLKSIILGLLLIIFSLGIIISGTMSVYLSTLFILIFVITQLIIKFIKNKKIEIKKIITLIASLLIMGLCFCFFNSHTDLIGKDLAEIKDQTSSALKGDVKDNFGTGRIYIWKNTIEKIKENYLTGVGIDNFRIAFTPPLIDPVSGFIVDKAHNDYLQKMLCEGIFAGITFIILLLIIFFRNLLKEKDNIKYGLFLAFISYSIQAFFNISVTRVAPIYFIIMGLLVASDKKKENKR